MEQEPPLTPPTSRAPLDSHVYFRRWLFGVIPIPGKNHLKVSDEGVVIDLGEFDMGRRDSPTIIIVKGQDTIAVKQWPERSYKTLTGKEINTRDLRRIGFFIDRRYRWKNGS